MRTRTLTVAVLVVAGGAAWYFWKDSGTTQAQERDAAPSRVRFPVSEGPRTERFTAGLNALAGGDTARAESLFTELVRAEQDLPTSLVFLGRARFERGNYAGAREAARVVVDHFEAGRDRQEAQSLLAECDRVEGLAPRALADGLDSQKVAQAVVEDSSRGALLQKIEALAQAQRWDEATALTQASIESLARFGGGESAWRNVEPFVRRLDALQARRVFDPRSAYWKPVHALKSGETLSHVTALAERQGYRFGVGFLQAVNAIRDPRTVPAGAQLKIPDALLHVRVHRDARVVLVYAGEELVRVYPCAIGKEGQDTPTGEFVITEKDPKPHWYSPEGGRVPYGHRDNPLGEGWLGFADTPEHRGYGIHGNNDEASIGTRASRGCIRLRNADVIELFSWVPATGTRVVIL